MSTTALAALAELAGITAKWMDAFGVQQSVPDETLRALLIAMDLDATTDKKILESQIFLQQAGTEHAASPLITAQVGEPVVLPATGAHRYRIECEDGHVLDGVCIEDSNGRTLLPSVDALGYHRLIVDGDEDERVLAVAPARCFSVLDALGCERAWGLAAQLYSLQREHSSDIGDYRSLQELARAARGTGADFIAVSPVHALFAADATRYSPYAPSNRLFLNILHIDIEALAELSREAPTEATYATSKATNLIDWPKVASTRKALLRHHFDALSRHGLLEPGTPTGRSFHEFCRQRGEALERHAAFEALHDAMLRQDETRWHWRAWPSEYRRPDTGHVRAFMQQHAPDLAFHTFLQWRAANDLAAAQSVAKDTGMGLGLIADLAVGTDPAGSYAWGYQGDLLPGVSVGAPPDLFNPLGQDWGLTTFSPQALRRAGFAPFINLLRATMRHAGGVRIDHILGLQRLWMVPQGASPRQGAYLAYPLRDLLRLVALESWRHRTVVIGEDLGTVPPGFRDILSTVDVMGTRVLWFTRDRDGFAPPGEWDRATLATSSTHDLPTVAGWWCGRDIDWRMRLNLLDAHETETALRQARDADRALLWLALCNAGAAAGEQPGADDAGRVIDAVATFVGMTSSALAMLPLEDVLGVIEQPNLPGTTDGHPNWQHRLPVSVDHMMDAPAVRSRLEALARTRRRP